MTEEIGLKLKPPGLKMDGLNVFPRDTPQNDQHIMGDRFESFLLPPPPPCPMPDCGVHYLWFAFVCFLIRSHPPPPRPPDGPCRRVGKGLGHEGPLKVWAGVKGSAKWAPPLPPHRALSRSPA